MSKVVDWIIDHKWAITPAALENILSISNREFGRDAFIEAVLKRDGEPLAKSYTVEMRDGVAVIPITGPIFPRANLFTWISGATSIEILAKDFNAALENPAVKAIVLNIDSPGGETTGISEFANMVYAARGKKPVTAYVYGLGASAAYWIASAAERIVMADIALVGCIGVVSVMTDARERDKKSGIVTHEIVSSRTPKKRPDITTDAGKAQVQKIVDDLADVFISTVARNRGVTEEKVQSDYGQGDVMLGAVALDAGMVDEIGNLESVIEGYTRSGYSNSGYLSSSFSTKGGLMDLNELKAKYPAIFQAAFDEGRVAGLAEGKTAGFGEGKTAGIAEGKKSGSEDGATAERARIQSIESLAVPGAESVIAENKFKPGMTRESVAVLVLENQKKASTDASAAQTALLAAHQADGAAVAEALKGVGNLPADQAKIAAEDKVISDAVAKVNATRK